MQLQELHDHLIERARALGLQGDTEEALLDALLEREVEVAPPTEEECRRWYDEHPAQFRAGEIVDADHILFAVTESVPLQALRRQAQQVLEGLLAAPERFGERAAEFSNCPSAQAGGNLGQLTRRDVVPEFWQAITQLPVCGLLPQLIETRFGLHIVRVARRIDGHVLPFEAVRERILSNLADSKLRRALRDYAHAQLHEAQEHHH